MQIQVYIFEQAILRSKWIKTNTLLQNAKGYLFRGGEGGIRTHVSVKTNAFRVRPVMTASILLRIMLNYFITERRKSQAKQN